MSIFAKIRVFFESVTDEMRKSTWPSREQVIESTILVIICTAALAMCTFGVDKVLGVIIQLLMGQSFDEVVCRPVMELFKF